MPSDQRENMPSGALSSPHRRLVQIGMIGFGTLLLALNLIDAAGSLSAMQAASETARQRLRLDVVGKMLRGVGFLGLFVSQAMTFRDWRTYLAPFTLPPGLPRGRRANRRLNRQLAGRQSYESNEIPLLRTAARRTLDATTPWLSTLSLILFFSSVVVSPINVPMTNAAADPTLFGRSFQVLGLVMGVVLLSLVLTFLPMRRRAQAFLDRTADRASENRLQK